ncbi:MAG: hypothetical protein EXQ52_15825 [Bryobacterales bacterium]|nr:hypothetical protein [Bryobacterales bacterium]
MRAFLTLLACLGSLAAATLERISLDDMIGKSTAIVRGRVSGSSAQFHGSMIYTHLKIQVLERWKGSPAAVQEIIVPGGKVANARQSFSGTPALAEGTEYVLFLWTGRNGLTHIIGLSQGVFDLKQSASGAKMATKSATSELMLEPGSGQVVKDEALEITLEDLGRRIVAVLGGKGGAK